MKVACAVTAENEERWIGSCLREAAKVADALAVFDRHSTDRTPEICRSFPGVQYWAARKSGSEERDRAEILEWARGEGADWILFLEGHEVLEEGAAWIIRRELSRLDPRDPIYTHFYLRVLYFWDDPELYRCEDGPYGDSWAPRLWRIKNIEGANPPGTGRKIDVCIKSYEYLYPYQREGKGQGAWQEGITLAKWSERGPEHILPGPFIRPIRYYQFVRPEAAGLIPSGAKKILEIGCGQGILGHLLKVQDPRREVVGIEINPMAAAVALRKLDHVLVGDVESIELDFPVGYFDCLIMLGVLEHLINPWDTLLYLKRFLQPGGYLILSVPNLRNFGVLNQLVNEGRWRYQESGILDRNHLRFFTLRDVRELLSSLHLVTEEIHNIRDPAVPDLNPDVELDRIAIRKLTLGEINEIKAKEFLIKARLCLPPIED